MSPELVIGLPRVKASLTQPEILSGAGWSACSDRGLDRSRNADAWSVNVSAPCRSFAVADGVGSLPASWRASAAAVRAVSEWARGQTTAPTPDVPSLLEAINAEVGATLGHDHQSGATTLACALIGDGLITIATVGDSEALAVGHSGPAERLNELDRLPSRQNVLLAWIDGQTSVEAHVIELDSLPHRLCLVTDGVAGAIHADEIASIAREVAPEEAAEALVRRAKALGASDDVTAVVVSDRLLLGTSS